MTEKPKRFVVVTNDDEDYVYVEESDGRVFALDAGGFLRRDGLPVGKDVTTYTPADTGSSRVSPPPAPPATVPILLARIVGAIAGRLLAAWVIARIRRTFAARNQ